MAVPVRLRFWFSAVGTCFGSYGSVRSWFVLNGSGSVRVHPVILREVDWNDEALGTEAGSGADPMKPPVEDVPSEALGGWSYWTADVLHSGSVLFLQLLVGR